MSFNKPYFAPMSDYSNTKKGMPMDEQEAWLDQFPQKRAENKPNGGIIRSIADTSGLDLRKMSPKERKAAHAKAQREHKEALKNLAKQEAQDAKEIAKQLVKWRKESKPKPTAAELAAKKEAKRLERAVLNANRRMASEKGAVKKERDAANKLPAVAQNFLDKLKEQGFYDVKDFTKSKSYMQIIVRQLRALGYKIEAQRKSKVIIRYILVNKKPLRK